MKWELEQEELSDGYYYSVYNENGTKISANSISKQDAVLVAAAPKLLAALEALHGLMVGDFDYPEMDAAMEAINEATREI